MSLRKLLVLLAVVAVAVFMACGKRNLRFRLKPQMNRRM